MDKPDKLPSLDPNVRGIFDLILATVAQVRKERQSREYRDVEARRELAAVALRKLKERELAEELRAAEAANLIRSS